MANKSLVFLCGIFTFLAFQINVVELLNSYRVTTIEGEPFAFKKQGVFYGYIPDVLQEAGRIVNASFQISANPDNQYGSFLDDGIWTGMIGQLINNSSDIAAADLTVTAGRARVVHFSQPYIDTGLRILIKKPQPWRELKTGILILSPLKAEVWIIGLVLFVVVSVLLTIIGRFSPWEQLWVEGGTFNIASAGMTLHNSLLFTFRSLLLQGSPGAPRSISGRMLACFWWIFCLFFVIVYAANLAAFFLTKEPLHLTVPFKTFEEMSQQTSVKFGFLKNSATSMYFKTSKQALDTRIFHTVDSDPSAYATSYTEGIRRVKDGDGAYAFIAESLSLEYQVSRECDLIIVGEQRSDRDYGFACRKDTTICRDLDVAILRLKEDGTLMDLYKKWFTGPCNAAAQDAEWNGVPYIDRALEGDRSLIDEKAVSLGRFVGPLVLLLIGAVLSLGLLAGEVLWVRRYGEPQCPGVSDDERRIRDPMGLSS